MPNTRASNEGDMQQLAGAALRGQQVHERREREAIQEWQEETMPPPSLITGRTDLERLERELIPLLNDIRRALGKRPIYIPKE